MAGHLRLEVDLLTEEKMRGSRVVQALIEAAAVVLVLVLVGQQKGHEKVEEAPYCYWRGSVKQRKMCDWEGEVREPMALYFC